MKRIVAGLAVMVFAVALSVSSHVFAAQPPAPKPENQPEMNAALEHLREAKRNLESASHDKGGHRAKAIEHVNQAIHEVEEGMRYDSTHKTPGERH